MDNQQYRQEASRNDERSQRGRDDWNGERDPQRSRERGEYRDWDGDRSRAEQGRGGRQNWGQNNHSQRNYGREDYGQGGYDRDQRGGRDQGGWNGDRNSQNYGERDQYDSGYAHRGQGSYQHGNHVGGYDRGQGQYSPNQRGGYQGGSFSDQGGGMQGGGESGQSHRGRGPKNYQRSDDRICEDVCDRLADDHDVDASNIDVSVSNREVTLAGEVDSKQAKRHAEDCADSCSGVEHVQNNLRVKRAQSGQDDDGSSKSKDK